MNLNEEKIWKNVPIVLNDELIVMLHWRWLRRLAVCISQMVVCRLPPRLCWCCKTVLLTHWMDTNYQDASGSCNPSLLVHSAVVVAGYKYKYIQLLLKCWMLFFLLAAVMVFFVLGGLGLGGWRILNAGVFTKNNVKFDEGMFRNFQ